MDGRGKATKFPEMTTAEQVIVKLAKGQRKVIRVSEQLGTEAK